MIICHNKTIHDYKNTLKNKMYEYRCQPKLNKLLSSRFRSEWDQFNHQNRSDALPLNSTLNKIQSMRNIPKTKAQEQIHQIHQMQKMILTELFQRQNFLM